MASNAKYEGNSVQYTNSSGATLSAGTMVSLNATNAQVAVLANDIANGASGTAFIVGAWTVTKATSTDTFAIGDGFKLDSSNKIVTTSGTGSPDVTVTNAKVIEASTASDETVTILISGL